MVNMVKKNKVHIYTLYIIFIRKLAVCFVVVVVVVVYRHRYHIIRPTSKS